MPLTILWRHQRNITQNLQGGVSSALLPVCNPFSSAFNGLFSPSYLELVLDQGPRKRSLGT